MSRLKEAFSWGFCCVQVNSVLNHLFSIFYYSRVHKILLQKYEDIKRNFYRDFTVLYSWGSRCARFVSNCTQLILHWAPNVSMEKLLTKRRDQAQTMWLHFLYRLGSYNNNFIFRMAEKKNTANKSLCLVGHEETLQIPIICKGAQILIFFQFSPDMQG